MREVSDERRCKMTVVLVVAEAEVVMFGEVAEEERERRRRHVVRDC